MIAGLPWSDWHFPLGNNVLFWTGLFALCIYPIVLLRSMRCAFARNLTRSSISFASQAGNYILIAVMVVVIIYGILYNKPSLDLHALAAQVHGDRQHVRRDLLLDGCGLCRSELARPTCVLVSRVEQHEGTEPV